MEATASSNPISEVTYYHFRHVLLVIEIHSSKMVKREETTQGCEDQEVAIIGAFLEAACHRHD